MRETWGKARNLLERAVMPHGAEYHRDRRARFETELEKGLKNGTVSPAHEDSPQGIRLQEMLDGLLRHPLCAGLNAKPALYVVHDPTAQFGVSRNAIVVPGSALPANVGDDRLFQMMRAVIAHELAHIICQDDDPARCARRPYQRMSQSTERRADLIAAHLCGDGGASLADYLAVLQPIDDCLALNATWRERVAARLTQAIDRRHPPSQERIRYLRKWVDLASGGQSLPDPFVRMRQCQSHDR